MRMKSVFWVFLLALIATSTAIADDGLTLRVTRTMTGPAADPAKSIEAEVRVDVGRDFASSMKIGGQRLRIAGRLRPRSEEGNYPVEITVELQNAGGGVELFQTNTVVTPSKEHMLAGGPGGSWTMRVEPAAEQGKAAK